MVQNTLVKVPIVFILCIYFFDICFGVGVGGEGGWWVGVGGGWGVVVSGFTITGST